MLAALIFVHRLSIIKEFALGHLPTFKISALHVILCLFGPGSRLKRTFLREYPWSMKKGMKFKSQIIFRFCTYLRYRMQLNLVCTSTRMYAISVLTDICPDCANLEL